MIFTDAGVKRHTDYMGSNADAYMAGLDEYKSFRSKKLLLMRFVFRLKLA